MDSIIEAALRDALSVAGVRPVMSDLVLASIRRGESALKILGAEGCVLLT